MRDFDPAYVADGSFTSFLPSRRVRFAPRADIRPMPGFMSTRPNLFSYTFRPQHRECFRCYLRR